MKKLIILLSTLLLALTACQKEEEKVDKGQLDPNAMITIKPALGVKGESLSALEVVEQAVNTKWKTHWLDHDHDPVTPWNCVRTFLESQKDYETPALLMLGIDVINSEGGYIKIFTHAFDVVITDMQNDTLAYVPNSVLRTAEGAIEAAYADDNYTEVYRLFDEAYKFIPITGPQWRELKATGDN